MAYLLAVLPNTPSPVDIYITVDLVFLPLFFSVVVLYFILEAFAQDNVTAEGFKQQLLQFPVEGTWPCQRTSPCLLSRKNPLGGPGTLCSKTDASREREGQKYMK